MLSGILIAHSIITDGNMSFRFGEENEVIKNREQFVANQNLGRQTSYVAMRCDHGSKITTVNRSNFAANIEARSQETMIESEVLVTQEKDLPLMLLTADCLPISFYDPVTSTIALAHMSRATIADGLPQKTVGFLREEHSVNPHNLHVHIGPHATTNSYHFPLPLESVSPRIAPFITERDDRAHIDLVAAHNHQLIEAGVQVENITIDPTDTITHPEYFSHYAETKLSKPAKRGRLATILTLKPK